MKMDVLHRFCSQRQQHRRGLAMQASLVCILNATSVLPARCLIKKKHRRLDTLIHPLCGLEEIKEKVFSAPRNGVLQIQN